MKKNLVVIGYGGMGGWHVAHAQKSDVVTLRGIYDIDPKKQEKAVQNGLISYPSLDAVLGDVAVDMVTVAIPNDQHKEVCICALKAGKHVICEKPVMLNSRDLDEVIAVANECGRLFTVHQNRRFDVDFLAVKELAKSQEIGELLRVESRIHGSRGIPSDWRGKKEFGGGMLYDWGVHLIDQVLQIFTAPLRSVYCTFSHITNQEVDDGFRLELTFADGKTAYVEVGTYQFIAMPRFFVQAQNGSALIRDWRENCQVAKCKYWHENDVLPVQTAAGLTKTMAPRDEVTMDSYELQRPASDVHDFYRNFCRAMDGEETQMVTHAEMRRVLRVMEAAFRSVELGNVVTMDE